MVGLTYAEAQAEARKVDVISARVAAVSPETEIVKHDGPWNLALDDLKQVDYIFGCVDTMGRATNSNVSRVAFAFRTSTSEWTSTAKKGATSSAVRSSLRCRASRACGAWGSY